MATNILKSHMAKISKNVAYGKKVLKSYRAKII